MKERHYRGKCEDTGVWVYGYYCPCCFGYFPCSPAIIDREEMERGCWRPEMVIPETVGQYTGLTDKNGTKIFEGDILKHHRSLWGKDISDIGVVFWNARTCMFLRTSSRNSETPQIWQETAEQYEVIGNIHDNPELLKGGAE